MEMKQAKIFSFLLGVAVFLLLVSGVAAKEAKIAQNLSALEAFEMVEGGVAGVYLIDVRTPAEYQQIGHPVMAYSVPAMFLSDEFVEKGGMFRGKKMTKTRYQYYKNPEYLNYIKKHFKADDVLLIMCRSGNRSVPASDFLAENGFNKVYNVVGGFEGGKFKGSGEEKDLMKKFSGNYSRRGFTGGWKYYGLPWTYTMKPKLVYGLHKK